MFNFCIACNVPYQNIIFGILLALIVIYNHRSNIKRIMNGEENKLGKKESELK